MQRRASSCAAVASLCDFDAVIQVQLKQLVEDADDKVFACVLHNQEHVLHTLLPGATEIPFRLRPGRHNLILSIKNCSIIERDFTTQMMFEVVS